MRERLIAAKEAFHAVAGHRPRGFLILFEGRTGSSYVVERLAAHSALLCVGEWIELRGGGTGKAQLAFTEDFYRRKRTRRASAIGMKCKFRHVIDPAGLRDVIDALDVQVIYLTRRNLIKWTISGIAALRLDENLGRANVRSPDERLEPFAIDPERLARSVELRRAWQTKLEAFLGTLRDPVETFTYEDMLADEAAYFARLHRVLGVPDQPTKSALIKATPRDVGELITNVAELRARFAGTELEAMFDRDA